MLKQAKLALYRPISSGSCFGTSLNENKGTVTLVSLRRLAPLILDSSCEA